MDGSVFLRDYDVESSRSGFTTYELSPVGDIPSAIKHFHEDEYFVLYRNGMAGRFTVRKDVDNLFTDEERLPVVPAFLENVQNGVANGVE